MSVYMISYDLNSPGQNYRDLKEKLESLGKWMHYLESTYVLETNLTASEIYDSLKNTLDDSDRILIMKTTGNWHALLPEKAYDWLDNCNF